MNLTRLCKERKKERRVTEIEEEEEKQEKKVNKKTGENKIPTVVNGVGALSLEIQTGNCSKSITQ